MEDYLQDLWDEWGDRFVERTLEFPAQHEFFLRDVFHVEWDQDIQRGQRNNLGKAIKAAFEDERYAVRLEHLEPPERQGNNNQKYKRM